MPQAIEDTVKALTEFEAALDRVKADALESKKKMTKNAGEWAESAMNNAITEAHKVATRRLSKAREEAEAEAKEIESKGRVARMKFEESMSKRKKEAAELVVRMLLGEE